MLNQERNMTILCATHGHRMLDICDRLIWIRDGRVERIARRDQVQIEVGSIGGEKA
jgi:putative ABC transport system ATP-binding protein